MKIAYAVGAALLALPVPAAAVVLNPTSNDETAPGNGTFTYQDDSYTGAYNSGSGQLEGGLGDLTDGVIAPAHWFTTPAPWVGWSNVNPTLTFHFANVPTLNMVSFWFDDAQGAGNVSLPTGVMLDAGAGALGIMPTISGNGIWSRYDYDLGGIATATLTATVVRSNQWSMLTEVAFDGTPGVSPGSVPEPASWAMMVGGFGLLGAAMRRRKVTLTHA